MTLFFHACIAHLCRPSLQLPVEQHVDEKQLLRTIQAHRLALQFIRLYHLNAAFQCSVTPAFIEQLRHQISFQKQLYLKKALIDLVTYLEQHTISYVVLKGLPLNQFLYGTAQRRLSKDIDILIDKEDLDSVHTFLLATGYRCTSILTPTHLKHCPRRVYAALKDITYQHDAQKIEIEVHWGTTITPCFNFSLKSIQSYRHTIELDHLSISILTHAHHFLYLCIHGAVSHWRRIQCLVDIAIFTQQHYLEWPTVLTLAQHHQAIRPLLEAKQLLKPYHVTLQAIPHRYRDRLCVALHGCYTRHLWRSLKLPTPWIEQLYQLLLYPSYAQKCQFILNRLLFNQFMRRFWSRRSKSSPSGGD